MNTATEGRGSALMLGSRATAAIVPVAAAAWLGSRATLPNIPGWYAALQKPTLTPPNWVFGPAWTLLYSMMALAFWRILSVPPGTPGRSVAVVTFGLQLVLNGAWSWAFFAARSPALGGATIVALLLAIAVAIAAARRVDRIAALLLVPYACWVSFAAYLNAGVWWLNR